MKRFTDTAKWTNNKWFFELSIELKLFWIYLLDNCDSVGVWEENIALSNVIIGYEYPLDTLLKRFKKQIYIFKDGRKWWIVDFCNFQYGKLSEDSLSKPIQSYVSLLKKHNLWKEYLKGIDTLKDKDKAKDKVKVKDKVKDKCTQNEIEFKKLTFQFSDIYSIKMLEDFVRYWTEKNKSGTKLRCELQQTFDIKKRLVTWSRNEQKFTKKTDIPNYDNLKREIFNDMAASDGNENPQ